MPITIHDIDIATIVATYEVREDGAVVAYTRNEPDAERVQLALLRAKPQINVYEAVRWSTDGPLQAMLAFRTRTGLDIKQTRQAFAAAGLHMRGGR